MTEQIILIYRYLRASLIIALFCLPFKVCAQNDTLCAKENSGDGKIYVGTLNILTLPEDEAYVYIDDVLVGYTPFLKKIAVGDHKLCIKKEHYYDYNEIITVSDSKMVLKVKLELMYGYIQVSSTPVGATVCIDGKETTLMTPCTTGKVNPGQVKMSLKLNDYQTFDTIISVDENSIVRVNASLQKSDSYNNVTENEYYRQLYADTSRLETMYASDLIASRVNVPANDKHASALWLKAGTGLSGVWGCDSNKTSDKFTTIFPTFNLGLEYSYRFCYFFGLEIGLMYSRTGYRDTYYVGYQKYSDKYQFNNIDVPILAKFNFLKNGLGPTIEIGPTVNYKTSFTRMRSTEIGETKYDKLSYNSFNVGATVGVGYDFKISKVVCTANVRGIMELTKIFDNVNYNLFYIQVGLGVKIY